MRFLVDNQLPPALAHWLAARGHEAEHVWEIGLGSARYNGLWLHARGTGSIVVSKDDDFLILANRPHDVGKLLWVRTGNLRTPRLLARFESAWPEILARFESGQHVVELR